MKRNFLMGAAALAGLATLSACGGEAGDASAPAAEETAAAPAAEEPAAPAEAAKLPKQREATEAAATDAAAAGGTLQLAGMTTDVARGESVRAVPFVPRA